MPRDGPHRAARHDRVLEVEQAVVERVECDSVLPRQRGEACGRRDSRDMSTVDETPRKRNERFNIAPATGGDEQGFHGDTLPSRAARGTPASLSDAQNRLDAITPA